MDLQHLLLEGAREDAGRQVLHPAEQAQVQVVAAIATKHVDAQEHLALSDRLVSGLALAELHAALVQHALDQQLKEAVAASLEARLAQLTVRRDELGHHDAGLLEAVHARRAGVPVFELGVVGETGQRQEQAQLAVVILGWAELLQRMQALHCLLHGVLQLCHRKVHRRKGPLKQWLKMWCMVYNIM